MIIGVLVEYLQLKLCISVTENTLLLNKYHCAKTKSSKKQKNERCLIKNFFHYLTIFSKLFLKDDTESFIQDVIA